MSTVIIGSGIIGVSTAYYLSQITKSSVHIIEESIESFASASGYAAGFLAVDWFQPDLSELGRLSFDLHKGLAEEHDGYKRWGYSRSSGSSLVENNAGNDGATGVDWLMEGVSRAIAAEKTSPMSGNAPSWLISKNPLDVLSSGETTAQVNPRHLCEFLISQCQARGVRLHQPARAICVNREADNALSSITVESIVSSERCDIPCARLVITAGAWTPQVFATLFPKHPGNIPVNALSGHALVLRSKDWPPPALDATDPLHGSSSSQDCHAVFTTEAEGDYSPEIFSRMPNGEIYLAGLNSSTYPLPRTAEDRIIDPKAIAILRATAERLLGTEAEVVRESVCWRPVGPRSLPIITEMTARMGKEGQGVFIAAGHGAWGISLSLGTGYVLARLIEGQDMRSYVKGLGLE